MLMHFTKGVIAGTIYVEKIMINYAISNLQMKVDFSMEVEVLKTLGSYPSGGVQGEVEIAKVVFCINFVLVFTQS